MTTLSILIPTIPERKSTFTSLLKVIHSHIDFCNAWQEVEILHDASQRGSITTGEKRNHLLSRARGEYIWFIDDDDMILEGAISEILKATETDCDVMAINGIMTTDGKDEKQWYIALGNPYEAKWVDGKEIYLRYPNHITPMKREIASQIKFADKNNFEDYSFAVSLKDSGLLKTETTIDTPVYYYKYSTQNKTY